MSITLTYDDVLSRVEIIVTGLSGIADEVTVDRSTNQVTWTTVRGGAALVPSAGTVTLSDYEFSANVLNYYRVRAYDTAAAAIVTGGPATSGNNTSLTPAVPLGMQDQDLLLVLASIRNSGTGVPNQPTGYTTIVDAGNQKLFGKIVTGAGEPAPTITFTGGVAGADTLAQTAAFRRTSLSAGLIKSQLNSVAEQNIPTPEFVPPDDNMMIIRMLWKQDDWTTITAGVGGVAIQGNGVISTAGDDAAQSWSYFAQTARTTIAASAAVATGGAAAISRASLVGFFHEPTLLSTETASITPMIDNVWFKVISKPFLNRTVHCVPAPSPIIRRPRQGIFPIVGRSVPVAVTDVRGSREFTLRAITRTTQEWQDFDLVLSTGDIFFVQAPPDSAVPTVYAAVDLTQQSQPLKLVRCDRDWRVFDLPLIEVAAPSPETVGSIGTWQTVVNTYATWSDVLMNHPTWADLLTLVGSTNDVIVP